MEYSNPDIPEGINYSNDHPLKDFFLLCAGTLGIILLVITLAAMSAGIVATKVPFEYEISLAQRASDFLPESGEVSQQEQDIRQYLQSLADELASHMDLPEGMTITVHYSDDDTVNAFATIGGNIIMYRGLLEKLPSENALAMVMAHEIAHILHRDPIVAVGRGFTITIALMLFTGMSDSSLVDTLVQQTSNLTALNYSRKQESAADDAALKALQAHYGHTNDAEKLFVILNEEYNDENIPSFLSTHPLNSDRIDNIKAFRQQFPSVNTGLKDMPDFLQNGGTDNTEGK